MCYQAQFQINVQTWLKESVEKNCQPHTHANTIINSKQ